MLPEVNDLDAVGDEACVPPEADDLPTGVAWVAPEEDALPATAAWVPPVVVDLAPEVA